MGFVTIKTPVIIAGVAGVGIRRSPFSSRFPFGTLATGFHNGCIHQCGAFDDVATSFQLAVEQAQQLLMQMAFDKPLPEPANGCFIRYGLSNAICMSSC